MLFLACLKLQTHGRREALKAKRFSIRIHVTLELKERRGVLKLYKAILPSFDDLQHLSIAHKAKQIVMSLFCAHNFL